MNTLLAVANQARKVRRVLMGLVGWMSMTWRGIASNEGIEPNVVVLSLGQLGRSVEVCKQAQAIGLRVHVFCHEYPLLEARYACGWTRLDCRTDMTKALIACRELKPCAILLESKNLLLPMQVFLADALGLRSLGEAAAISSNSKIRLRECVDDAGLAQMRWAALQTVQIESIEFPVIIKPDLGTSSKGVRMIGSREEFESGNFIDSRTKADASVGDQMLVEGYVKGRQFDMEGLAIDGDLFLMVVVEEHYEAEPPYFPPAWFLFNPPIGDVFLGVLWKNAQTALAALGVVNGAWHIEQRIDCLGRVHVLDYANRMGYNLLVSRAAGTSFAGTYVKSMLAEPCEWPTRDPEVLVQVFALERSHVVCMRALLREHPNLVHSHSFVPYEFSYHTYYGYLVMAGGSFRTIVNLMDKYRILPEQFKQYYSGELITESS